jgi:hypothetical protein
MTFVEHAGDINGDSDVRVRVAIGPMTQRDLVFGPRLGRVCARRRDAEHHKNQTKRRSTESDPS